MDEEMGTRGRLGPGQPRIQGNLLKCPHIPIHAEGQATTPSEEAFGLEEDHDSQRPRPLGKAGYMGTISSQSWVIQVPPLPPAAYLHRQSRILRIR